MENELLKLTDETAVQIPCTRRQARLLYDLLGEELTRLRGLTYTLVPGLHMDRIAQVETQITDYEGICESLFFDGQLDDDQDSV